MTYKEMNNFCNQNNVYGSQFYIAEEMTWQLDSYELQVSEDRFEELCDLAHTLYLKADNVSVLAICRCVAKLENGFVNEPKEPNPVKMDKWDLINLASEYEN